MILARKKQIAWWASKVYEQAQEYADIADSKREHKSAVANKLDTICRLCNEIHWELAHKVLIRN